MTDIVLNEALIDWITLTTWDIGLSEAWYDWLKESGWRGKKLSVMQYEGLQMTDGNGTIFHGIGKEVNSMGELSDHAMLRASGAVAEIAFEAWRDYIASGLCKATRIDLQVTIAQPDEYNPVTLLAECEAAGMKPEMKRSPAEVGDGELCTVYTGSRASGRLNRTYQKQLANGDYVLRFETEILREYAEDIGSGLSRGRITRQDIIRGEAWRRREVGFFSTFPAIWQPGVKYAPRMAKTKSSKTEKWLWNVVLPALARYANMHDADPSLLLAIRKAVEFDVS